MNSSRLMMIFVVCLAIVGSASVGNEFIKQQPVKEKRFYPSCQHYIELDGDVIDAVNSAFSAINTFSKELISIQRTAIDEINGYLEGDKSCALNIASKAQRADLYDKKMKVKNEVDGCVAQLMSMQSRLKAVLCDKSMHLIDNSN